MKWVTGTTAELWYTTADGEIHAIINRHSGGRWSFRDRSFINVKAARLHVEAWYNGMLSTAANISGSKDILSE